MKIVDLSIPLENDVPADPPFQKVSIAYRHHADTAGELVAAFPGLRAEQLPDGQGWAVEQVNISTHSGTQVSALAGTLTKPGNKWYLVTADYALGHQLEADTRAIVAAKGGVYAGSVRHAFPATDLSSQLLTAQGSGADIIALANAGGDTVTGIKTARDFGIGQDGQRLVAFFMTVMDVKSVGLKTAKNTVLTEGSTGTSTRARAPSRSASRHRTAPRRPRSMPGSTRPPCTTRRRWQRRAAWGRRP